MDAAEPSITTVADLLLEHRGHTYREFLRVPALSLGLFAVGPRHEDRQGAHGTDEVYVVLGGSAVLVVEGRRMEVAAGSVAYVPAETAHRFEEITTDLRVLVVFAPPDAAASDVTTAELG